MALRFIPLLCVLCSRFQSASSLTSAGKLAERLRRVSVSGDRDAHGSKAVAISRGARRPYWRLRRKKLVSFDQRDHFPPNLAQLPDVDAPGDSEDETLPPALSAFGIVVVVLLMAVAWLPCLKKPIGLVDSRSLGFGRVLCGLVLLANVWERSKPEEAALLYTEDGLLPCEECEGWIGRSLCQNGFAIGPMFFRTGLLLAFCVTLGFCTCISTFGSWLFLLVLDSRNGSAVTACGDNLLYMVFFWAMFIPWGQRWSVDGVARWSPKYRIRDRVTVSTPGAFGFALQVVIAYLGAGTIKTGPEWVGPDYTAVALALHIDSWATDLGYLVGMYPRLCKALTCITIHLEVYGPWLLVLPLCGFAQHLRLLGVVTFLGFMVSLGLCLYLGIIPYIFSAALCCLLPSIVWKSQPDGDDPEELQPLMDVSSGCLRQALSCIPQSVAFVFLAFMLLDASGVDLPDQAAPAMQELLRQRSWWQMFNGGIEHYDSWLLLSGTLSNGTAVDLGAPQAARTLKLGAGFNTSFYLNQYVANLDSDQSLFMAAYFCRTWNAASHLVNTVPAFPSLANVEIDVVEDTTLVSKDGMHMAKNGAVVQDRYRYTCLEGGKLAAREI